MTSNVRQVSLNVYNLHRSNFWLQHIGLGMYHSGVEVGGVEYTFSEVGIAQHTPRDISAEGCTFKATEILGDFVGSLQDLRRILNRLREESFAEGAYDVVRKNCNHFSDEFSLALVGRRIPAWVNRAATLGSWAGLSEKKDVATSRLGVEGGGQAVAASATAAAPSRERKVLTKKQRELLSKMRSSKSSSSGKDATKGAT